MSKKVELGDEINVALNEIQELLHKSGYGSPLRKEDEFPEEGMEQPQEEGMEFPEEGMEQPEEEGMEMPEEGMGEEDPSELIAEYASGMSDEELSSLIEMLSQQLQGRQQPEQEVAEKSADFSGLQKSIEMLSSKIEKMGQTKEAPKRKVATKAATNQRVEALEKSTKTEKKPVMKRLNKSQTQDFILGQIKKGNANANSKQILDLQYIHTDEELNEYQDALVAHGLELPKL